jgi:hypothetical protein
MGTIQGKKREKRKEKREKRKEKREKRKEKREKRKEKKGISLGLGCACTLQFVYEEPISKVS